MALQVAGQLETRLEAAARQQAVDASSYVPDLLGRALDAEYLTHKPQPSADELMAGFQRLAENATASRNYPDDFFSREVIYEDHD